MNWSVAFIANTGKERKQVFSSLAGAVMHVGDLNRQGINEFKLSYAKQEPEADNTEAFECEELDYTWYEEMADK